MKVLLGALVLLFLTGCAQVFSDNALRQVDPSIAFGQLKSDVQPYIGKYVKLGGIIAGINNTGEGSQLEIVQFNLGSDHIPNESAVSGGRFLAITPDYLDNMIYRTGRRVAVIGEVKEMRTLPLDQTEYTYPVIAILEIRVWPNVEDYPVDRYYDDPFFYSSPWYGPKYWRYGHGHPRHWHRRW
jgi:outer membrane lipoprotein